MNYTAAGDAPNGTDVTLIKKLAPALSKAADTKIKAADPAAHLVLVHLREVVEAVQYVLLNDLVPAASDAVLDTAIAAHWDTIQAVATEIGGEPVV